MATALLAFSIVTCDSLDNIDVTAEGQTVIPQRSVLDELLGSVAFTGLEQFDIRQTQEFENQGYTKDQIDSVRLRRFTLGIAAPEEADFDFLTSIRFYAESADLPRVLVAELDSVPTDVSDLDLDVIAGVELQPYVVAPSMSITTEASGTRPAQETTVDAEVVFDVDVAVSGACR